MHMGGSLCFPFDTDFPAIAPMVMVSMVNQMFAAKEGLLRQGADYGLASRVMLVQRLFNRARVAPKFAVQELPDFMRGLRRSRGSVGPRVRGSHKGVAGIPQTTSKVLNCNFQKGGSEE